MTVSRDDSWKAFVGDGVTTSISLPWKFYRQDDLVVYETEIATGVSTLLVRGADYDVSGAGEDEGDGAVVVLKYGGLGVPATHQWSIARETLPLQESSVTEGDAFPRAAIEQSLDRMTLRIQDSQRLWQRALKTPPDDDPDDDMTLPNIAERKGGGAGTVLGFGGADGLPYVLAGTFPGAIGVTAFGATLAQAADAAAGRAVLGVPTLLVGTLAARPAFGTAGRIYFASDELRIYVDSGAAWLSFTNEQPQSYIRNPDFSIWSRGDVTSTSRIPNNDGVVAADGWRLLSDGNGRAYFRSDPVFHLGGRSNGELDVTGAAPSPKFAALQILESRDCPGLGGSPTADEVTIQLRAMASNAGRSIRVAVLRWAGTANAPTSDPISNWNPSTGSPVTDEEPTLVANWSYCPVGGNNSYRIDLSTSPTTYAIGPFDLSGGSKNNLALLIWINDTGWGLPQALYLDQVCLFHGAVTGNYQAPSEAENASRCQRFTLVLEADPTTPLFQLDGYNIVAGTFSRSLVLPTRMVKAPAVSQIGTAFAGTGSFSSIAWRPQAAMVLAQVATSAGGAWTWKGGGSDSALLIDAEL
jgi:hypothetical protein